MSPTCHPGPFPHPELPASLVGCDVKEGGRKERIPLNNGDAAELPRMLVPFSLYSRCDEVLSGCSVLLPRLRQQSLFAKAVAVLILPTRELVTCRRSLSRSTMTHFGVRTQPRWTGTLAGWPLGVDTIMTCHMRLPVHPPTTCNQESL